MRATYNDELRRLPSTYAEALRAEIGPFADLSTSIAGQAALFVASGGGLAAAQIAAELHVMTHGQLASAVTPLGLVGEGTVRHAAVVAISARAAHPDVAFALRAARTRHNYPVCLITQRVPEDLPRSLVGRLTSIIQVPLTAKDGFLATNSVLGLSTLFVRACDPQISLPNRLPWLTQQVDAIERERCLVLFGPGYRSAATDLETRLSELGIASVQATDFRNFAHGRHTGFARNLESTTVVALFGPLNRRLAEATLETLPTSANVIRLETGLAGLAGTLDLLGASMRVVGASAGQIGLDPARPRVPPFGRKLYHLSARSYLDLEAHSPINRKLSAVGSPSSRLLHDRYRRALESWLDESSQVTFGGVVIDYDGTVCETSERYSLPREDIRGQLLRLLDEGCRVGIATGRGRSVYDDLRRWVPRGLWSWVTLGLYNGYIALDLNDEIPESGAKPSGELAALLRRVEGEPLADLAKIEARGGQVSIEPVTGAGVSLDALHDWLSELIARQPELRLKLFRSGHSLDVVEPFVSKVSVLRAVEAAVNAPVLAIGDRGDIGGNDFELLAAQRWTLSVDRCSGDISRCWNLARPGISGPAALAVYLRQLKQRRAGWRLYLSAQ